MVKQDEAEKLAIEAANQYLTICGCESAVDRARALMKLASVSGVMMVAATGPADGINRMQNTADFIRNTFSAAVN